MVAKAKLRHYAAEEKEKATKRAMEVGYRAASVELGIPWGTLSCWVFKARKGAPTAGSPVTQATSPAPQADSTPAPTPSAPPSPAPTPATPRPTARPRPEAWLAAQEKKAEEGASVEV